VNELREDGAILLLATYELGRPPHLVASLAAFLEAAGFAPRSADLAVERLEPEWLESARLIVVTTEMHTALRVAIEALGPIRERAPDVPICFAGLYAALHRRHLVETLGIDWVVAGELEAEVVAIAEALASGVRRPPAPPPRLRPLPMLPPRREALELGRYARFIDEDGGSHLAGATATTRGCLDVCRHCPVSAVYGGRFVAVPAGVVLADVEAQVAAGAAHISFTDPDFLNGPTHALRVARELHQRWPALTFDFTAQIAHLLDRRETVAELAVLGAAFATTAVESLSDRVLEALGKRHRRGDIDAALDLAAAIGLPLRPTLVAFTPWTELADLVRLADWVTARGLAHAVAPVQLSIRLLVPPGSLLLEAAPALFGELVAAELSHRWRHPDPRLDSLQRRLAAIAAEGADNGEDDAITHRKLAAAIRRAAELPPPRDRDLPPPPRIPRVSEPWFC
jgi:radical SAM superfamily enzyme YgiQ (UPF0313 family)